MKYLSNKLKNLTILIIFILLGVAVCQINFEPLAYYVSYYKWRWLHAQKDIQFHEVKISVPEKWWVIKNRKNYIQFARVQPSSSKETIQVGINKHKKTEKRLKNFPAEMEYKGLKLQKAEAVKSFFVGDKRIDLLTYSVITPGEDQGKILLYWQIPSIKISVLALIYPKYKSYCCEIIDNLSFTDKNIGGTH